MAVLNTGTGHPGKADLGTRRRVWLLVIVLLLGSRLGLAAQTAESHEYQVKAVFLFNFAQFVEWPREAFSSPVTPFVIGVLGANPFGTQLEETVHDEAIGQRPLVVRRYNRVEEIDTCHILFISRSEAGRLDQVLATLKNRPILTVSDAEGFALRGVMIRFLTEKSRIRLKINLAAAKAAGLILSSKLLRPAEIVSAGKD